MPALSTADSNSSYRLLRASWRSPATFGYSRPRTYRLGDDGRRLYFTRVIFASTDFPTSLNRFLRNCHTTRYILKLIIPYGVFICVALLKIWGSKNPNFRQFADPKSTLWVPPFHNAREIWKYKTTSILAGVPPPAEIGCSLGAWAWGARPGWGRSKHSNRHDFSYMTASHSVFDSIYTGGFSGLSYPTKTLPRSELLHAGDCQVGHRLTF